MLCCRVRPCKFIHSVLLQFNQLSECVPGFRQWWIFGYEYSSSINCSFTGEWMDYMHLIVEIMFFNVSSNILALVSSCSCHISTFKTGIQWVYVRTINTFIMVSYHCVREQRYDILYCIDYRFRTSKLVYLYILVYVRSIFP